MWDFQSRFGGTYSGILLYLGLTVIFPLDCIKITLFAPKYLSLLYFTYLNVTLERNHVTYKTVIKLIFMHRWCVNDQVKLIQPSVYYHALELTVLLKYTNMFSTNKILTNTEKFIMKMKTPTFSVSLQILELRSEALSLLTLRRARKKITFFPSFFFSKPRFLRREIFGRLKSQFETLSASAF